ncbi:F-box protein [Phanerochaete sordida]|uniref:F-box protein n=1 Tax=Phanerochaete sordida TaxID=48140 RepID=A0A9P3LGZ1_9APHY|nr:F-box protein [Phanerochaete sordida]
MHSALETPEIVQNVFIYLSKASLVALATVCRSLSGIALDELWRKMSSLDPLYQCLPQKVWAQNESGHLVPGVEVPRNSEDWVRFNFYAARIHELSFSEDSAEMRPDLLKIVKVYLPAAMIPLPQLSALRLVRSCTDAELGLLSSTVLHPGIRRIEISSVSSASVLTALSFAQLSCPDLIHLVISKTVGVLPMLAQFKNIRTLVYDSPSDNLDDISILRLSRLPFLQKLQLTSPFISNSFPLASSPSNLEDVWFPSLEDLTLGCVIGLEALSRLIRMIDSSSLRSMSLAYILSKETLGDTRSLALSLALHPQLVNLSLSGRRMHESVPTLADFHGLSSLSSLQEVSFANVRPCEPLLADPKLGWHKLRVLRIESELWVSAASPSNSSYKLSLLRRLASCCPCLAKLHIRLCITSIPPAQREIPRRDRPIQLVLCAASRSTVDAYFVAEFISDIYPHMTITYETDGTQRGESSRAEWEIINRGIARIAATRAEERRRTEAEVLERVLELIDSASSVSIWCVRPNLLAGRGQ